MSLRRFAQYARKVLADWRWSADRETFRNLRCPPRGLYELRTRVAGKLLTVHVRGGTIDAQLARLILCEESEYRLPAMPQPRVVFDVGANIGLTTLYFASVFPAARIFSFEPLPQNVELLRRNVAPLGERVTVIPKGLGAADGSFAYRRSDDPANFGGGGFVDDSDRQALLLPVTTVAAVCRQHHLHAIDLMKIDTEGSELAVLRGTPLELLRHCRAVIGELHGEGDLEVLSLLSQAHEIGMTKPLGRRCFPFVALRKAA